MKVLFTVLLFTLIPLTTLAAGITTERINAYIAYVGGKADEGAEFRFDDIETWLFAKYIKLSKIDVEKTAAVLAKQAFLRKTLLRGTYENEIDVRAEMRQFIEGNLLEIGSLNADLSFKDKVLLELFFKKMDAALRDALKDKYMELRLAPFIYLSKNTLFVTYQAGIFEKKVGAIFKSLYSFIGDKRVDFRMYAKNGILDKKLLKGVKAGEKILGAEWQLTLCSSKDGYLERDSKADNLCMYFKAAPYAVVLYTEMVGDDGNVHSGEARVGPNNTVKYKTIGTASVLLPMIPHNAEKGDYFILMY